MPFYLNTYKTIMYDLFQLARNKLAQEAALPDQDLRVIVAHANLVDVLRQSLSYVEEDFDEYKKQMIRAKAAAKAAALGQEYLLSMDNDGSATSTEDPDKELDKSVHRASDSELSSRESESESSSEEEDPDEIELIEDIKRAWSLPRNKSWPNNTITVRHPTVDEQDLSSLRENLIANRNFPRECGHHVLAGERKSKSDG